MSRLLIPILLGCVLCTTAVYAEARAESPLLLPGKRTLYQRVLASPGASLYQAPDGAAGSDTVLPFTTFYVYERKNEDGTEWLRVGSDSHGGVVGWIPEPQSIPWNQALTVTFKAPHADDRVLLFRDRDSLKRIVEGNDLAAYQRYYGGAANGHIAPDSPVVAIQPAANIDIEKDFYLVPIKQHEDVYLGSERARLLQVASVPLGTSARSEASTDPAASGTRKYRSGICFVIDSTQSMRPYIDRTREVVRRIYQSIEAAGLREQVSFGLTAFRDDLRHAPESEYLARNFVTLEEGSDPERFFAQVEALAPASESNEDFIEDSFAGVKSAIDGNDWGQFDARYIVLVTDAGGREADDPLSSTGLAVREIRQLAQDRGIALWVLHLQTPMGKYNHAKAERQYRILSEYPGIGDFYYGVELGKVESFGRVLQALATQITEQVAGVQEAEQTTAASSGPRDEALAELQEKVAKLGYALQMRYLGTTDGQSPPKVFDAWLVDRDLKDPKRTTIEVRVLLTRDQLSDLRNSLQQVLELAEEGVLSPRNFINELKAMAARLSRNPEQVAGPGEGGSLSLAELGYVGEYVEDLPYVSEVMGLSLADWEEWPAERQIDFVNRLDGKISYYQALHDHTDLWVSLNGGPVDGDSVFPVLLEMLP